MIIGEIFEVRGVKVRAKLFENMPPYLVRNKEIKQGPRIHAHIKTNVGLDKVICKIVGEEQRLDKDNIRILELLVIGNFIKEKFYPGIKVLPLVSAKIELLEPKEITLLYFEPIHPIFMGSDLFNPSLKVALDLNKIAASHVGVFGNTGSGKSNTLTRIIREYINAQLSNNVSTNKSKLIIFDLNNEYGGNAVVDKEFKSIYKLSTTTETERKFPLDFESLTEDQIGVLLSATKKTQMPVIKTAVRNKAREYSRDEKILSIKWAVVNGQKQIVSSIKQELRDIVTGLDNIVFIGGNSNSFIDESRTTMNEFGLKRYHFINNINDIALSDIDVKLPDNVLDRIKVEIIYAIVDYLKTGNNFEFVRPLIGRMNSRIADFKKVFENNQSVNTERYVTIVQLGNVNREMKEVIPSIISSVSFENVRKTDREAGFDKIQIFVIDEAHNILYQAKENDDVASNNVDTFETIIKEGRKYGVFLWLASQRPSDISPTITSQVHNYFIHKLVNNADVQAIRKTVPYMGEEMMDMVSALGVGECIISGQALTTPTFAKVDLVPKKNMPLSANIELFGDDGIFNE